MKQRIFLFGEAERGQLCTPICLNSLPAVMEHLGHPPTDSTGIDYAIQTVLYKRELIFFRVREEGYSANDYFEGVKLLYTTGERMNLAAICLPGVGDHTIIDAITPICNRTKSILVLNERDLYDYLTNPN
ncbi:MAG: hypothetical protein JSS30_00975 [Verrucomicrobia bacterium]|nr:hypothetical protein [Verrucomicrobiota bacterium]